MRSTVGPSLPRMARWFREELEDAAIGMDEARPEASEMDAAPAAPANAAATGSGKSGEHGTQAKSVRISLARLADMMNSVGELVLNRTRLLGRMAGFKQLLG